MGTLSRCGILVENCTPEIKKELTVRPVTNALGITAPSFKVWRKAPEGLLVPRYYGLDKFGPPTADTRPPCAPAPGLNFTGKLRQATRQPEALAAGVAAFKEKGGGVLSLPCGYGKCLGKDTPVMMFDGTVRKVQDIRSGELIMGDDSTPRNVLSTCTGTEQLYKIVPTKGDPYIVNESHILSLKYVQRRNKKCGQVLDISILDYLNTSSDFRHNEVRGYRVPISFPEKEVPLDPYMFGYWLGDGSSRAARITSQDSTVLHYFHRNLGKYGAYLDHISKYDYSIKSSSVNYFYKTLKELGVIGNKHIPHIYKFNSRKVRLQVLAGLLDSDGSAIKGGWDFCQKNETLFDDVMFLARSLGFACYKQMCEKTCTNAPGGPKMGTYFRCSISGAGVEDVLCKVPRKKIEPREQIKDVLNVGIKVEKLEVGEYFGFEIDGNHRFVLGDFTVTHNTTVALALSAQLKVRTMIVVHKEFLANQWVDKIKEFCPGATIGRVQGDSFDTDKDFVIAMIQTMCMREFPENAFDSIGLLVVDEAHHIGAPAFSQFMFKICPKYTLGLTATPERKDGLTRLLYWFLGPEFFRIERQNQGTTRVVTLDYSCDAFKEAPPVTRFGQINMAGMINVLTELEDRNRLILRTAEEALTLGRRVLILSDRREHCLWLQKQLGSKSGLYIGGMKEKDLEESARAPIVIATFQLAHEGLDIPALDTVILSTPKSDIKQSIGRIMRETAGKANEPLIYDVADHWSVFFAMYRKRMKVYREGGFETGAGGDEPEETKVFSKGVCLF
jgi:superfamily II DNA or RNA helicase